MLSELNLAVIKELKKRGVHIKDIAATLGVHPRTVNRTLQRGGEPVGRGKKRVSKFHPFEPKVEVLLRENVWNCMVILSEIREDGCKGSASILRGYTRQKGALRPGSLDGVVLILYASTRGLY